MNRRPHRTRAESGRRCEKEVYATRLDAEDSLVRIRALRRAGAAHRRERYVQACWDCGTPAWHLTSHPVKKNMR